MSRHDEISTQLGEQAAEWFMRVRAPQVEAEVYTEWLAWIESSPQHRAAFAAVQEAWDLTREVSLDQVMPEQSRATFNAPVTRSHAMRWAAGIAAVGFVAILTISIFMPQWLADSSNVRARIATGRGEPRSTILADGTRVELGALTGVEVAFTPQQRLVTADEGEAYFKIKHDPDRPFIVETGPVRVTATGTAFAVRREGSLVLVRVTEGSVNINVDPDSESVRRPAYAADQIPAVRASAGQQVKFDGVSFATKSGVAGEADTVEWRKGQLRFEEDTLAVVVSTLNRYSTRRIVIGDPALERLLFTGVVYEDRVKDWLNAAKIVFQVDVDESQSDRIVIVARR